MITIQEYVIPNTIDEAYEILNKRKANTILGGCTFLRLGKKKIHTAIDLQNLGLNKIVNEGDYLKIGGSCTLRQIEVNEEVKAYYNGILSNAISNIVGVQFRNLATVGASVFSKYGFSDLIPVMLAVGAKVFLYGQGLMSMEKFLNSPFKKDLLVEVLLPIQKNGAKASYKYLRNSHSDFPILNGAAYIDDKSCRIVIGARPMKAKVSTKASIFVKENRDKNIQELIEAAGEIVAEELTFGTNIRGDAFYRRDMSKILTKRMLKECL